MIVHSYVNVYQRVSHIMWPVQVLGPSLRWWGQPPQLWFAAFAQDSVVKLVKNTYIVFSCINLPYAYTSENSPSLVQGSSMVTPQP